MKDAKVILKVTRSLAYKTCLPILQCGRLMPTPRLDQPWTERLGVARLLFWSSSYITGYSPEVSYLDIILLQNILNKPHLNTICTLTFYLTLNTFVHIKSKAKRNI